MNIKPIIFTTTQRQGQFGRWFEEAFGEIYSGVTKARAVTMSAFDIQYWKAKKTIGKRVDNDGDTKIDLSWYKKEFTQNAQGYNCIIFHTTSYWRKKWGLSTYINGLYWADTDGFIEIYVCADTVQEFSRIVRHELLHFVERTQFNNRNMPTYGCDKLYESRTHKADYCDRDIDAMFAQMDLTEYTQALEKRITLFDTIRLLMIRILQTRLTYPVDKDLFTYRVSQRFGVPQKSRRSGIHNGLDLALAIGTNIKAPTDCEVYRVYKHHRDMGHACYLKFTHKGIEYHMRLLHLLEVPELGMYKKGQIVARSGNSGDSTGPHLHMEVWRRPIDIKVLYSEKTVRENLVDPYKFFLYEVDNIIV